MNKKLDNAGVARKVGILLTLPVADRALELQLMKANFTDWMKHNFNLTSHQAERLDKLPDQFSKQLSAAISNYLMQGNLLQFQKDEKHTEDSDFTELTVHGLEHWQDDIVEGTFTPLFIRISYPDQQR